MDIYAIKSRIKEVENVIASNEKVYSYTNANSTKSFKLSIEIKTLKEELKGLNKELNEKVVKIVDVSDYLDNTLSKINKGIEDVNTSNAIVNPHIKLQCLTAISDAINIVKDHICKEL